MWAVVVSNSSFEGPYRDFTAKVNLVESLLKMTCLFFLKLHLIHFTKKFQQESKYKPTVLTVVNLAIDKLQKHKRQHEEMEISIKE